MCLVLDRPEYSREVLTTCDVRVRLGKVLPVAGAPDPPGAVGGSRADPDAVAALRSLGRGSSSACFR